jgi:hypothetical protein
MRTALFLTLALTLSACLGPRQDYNTLKSSLPAPSTDIGRIFVYRDAVFSPHRSPAVVLNGHEIAPAKALGFFYMDQPAGDHTVAIAGESAQPLRFTLAPGQILYVRINLHTTLPVSRFYPTIVDATTAQREMAMCKIVETAQKFQPSSRSRPAPVPSEEAQAKRVRF